MVKFLRKIHFFKGDSNDNMGKKEELEIQAYRYVTPKKFAELLPNICGRETVRNPEVWTDKNPLIGQCAIVSVIAQEFFGGTLLQTFLNEYPEFAYLRSYFVNEL